MIKTKNQTQHARLLITQLLNHLITNSLPIVMLFIAHVVEACPACKEALFDPGQLHQKLSAAKGYAVSIILFLSVPLLLISAIATLIIRAQRQHREN